MRVLKRAFAALLILMIIVAPTALADEEDIPDVEIAGELDSGEIDPNAFSGAVEVAAGAIPEISSPSAILIEFETGDVLYEKDADAKREPASVTKIMTELLVLEAIDAGTVTLDDMVTTTAHAASMGGTQIWLREGERMSVNDLLKAVAVNSANDAAVALAEHVAGSESSFVAMMNARANELGMKNTNFTNCSGLIKNDAHYTTARDVAIMSRELMSHETITDYTTIWMDTLRGGETELVNTNRLVHYFDGTTGLKTGYTSSAGYCLSAAAKRDGVEYISVTLGDATSNDRFENARTLLSYAFATYTTVPASPDNVLSPIKVDLGEARFVQPQVMGPSKLLVTRSDAAEITKTVEVASQLLAPIREGDEIGRLYVKVGDRLIADLPIVAGNGSERLGWGEIFGQFMSLLFTPTSESL